MEGIFIASIVTFVKILSPVAAILAFILFVKPKTFISIEKKLSAGVGKKKLSHKSIELLERENMILQNLLVQYNRLVGFILFVFSLIIIFRLYMEVSL